MAHAITSFSRRTYAAAIALTGALALTACSTAAETESAAPVSTPASASATPDVGASATPEATEAAPSPSASPSPTAIDQSCTTEYAEGVTIEAGVFIADPDGEPGAKPEELYGTPAYFADGTWCVFDPAVGIPERASEIYFVEDLEASTEEFNVSMANAVNDMMVCVLGVNQADHKDEYYYQSNVLWWEEGAAPLPEGQTDPYVDVNSLVLSGWLPGSRHWENEEETSVNQSLSRFESHRDEIPCANTGELPRLYSLWHSTAQRLF